MSDLLFSQGRSIWLPSRLACARLALEIFQATPPGSAKTATPRVVGCGRSPRRPEAFCIAGAGSPVRSVVPDPVSGEWGFTTEHADDEFAFFQAMSAAERWLLGWLGEGNFAACVLPLLWDSTPTVTLSPVDTFRLPQGCLTGGLIGGACPPSAHPSNAWLPSDAWVLGEQLERNLCTDNEDFAARAAAGPYGLPAKCIEAVDRSAESTGRRVRILIRTPSVVLVSRTALEARIRAHWVPEHCKPNFDRVVDYLRGAKKDSSVLTQVLGAWLRKEHENHKDLAYLLMRLLPGRFNGKEPVNNAKKKLKRDLRIDAKSVPGAIPTALLNAIPKK